MKPSWRLATFDEVVHYRKEFIEITDTEKYKRCRVQLHAQGIVLRDVVVGAEIKTKRQQLCRAGEFLVAEIDAKVGGFGIIPDELDGAIVSSHYFLFEIKPELLERRFLDYFIRTPFFRDQVQAQGSTNYAAIRPNDVLGYQIPLPSPTEQQRIVARIEELVAKIEEARGLRREAINDVSALICSLHLKLAQGRVVSLADVLCLEEHRQEIRSGQQYPQVGGRGFGAGLFAKDGIDGAETTYKTFNRLFQGAVVLSRVKGWEGAVGVCNAKLAGRFVSPEYRTFSCIAGMASPAYLSVLFSTPWFWNQLKTLSRGVGARRERTRPEHFLRLQIPMPTIERQEWVMPTLERLEKSKQLQLETLPELDALLPSILDKAFKGEL